MLSLQNEAHNFYEYSYRQNRDDGRSVNLPNGHQSVRKAHKKCTNTCIPPWMYLIQLQLNINGGGKVMQIILSEMLCTSSPKAGYANHFISSAKVAASCSLEWSRCCSMFHSSIRLAQRNLWQNCGIW